MESVTAGKNNSSISSILKSIVLLSLPAIAEEILSTLLQYVDTAMVGHLGEQATAAVSVTTTITWLVNSIPYALGTGCLPFISQALGRKDGASLKKYSRIVFFLTVVSGVVLGVISMVLSPFIPVWMGAEENVCRNASIYFFIVSVPMVFRTSTIILGSSVRAVADTKTPMVITMVENIINVILNLLFIYGFKMGVTGAALGSAISYTVSGILMFIVYRRNANLYWKFADTPLDFTELKQVAGKSVPVLAANVSSCFAYVVFAGLVSGMGTVVFAAHSIAITVEEIFYIAGYGIRTATSTLVGISIGEKDEHKFKTVCVLSISMTVIMMIINGAVLYAVSLPLMNLMTISEPVAVLGSQMLRLVSFSEPFFGLMIVCQGILYGMGKTRLPFIGELVTMWGIRVLFTFLCVKIWHLDLQAVWFCMIACNIAKALFFFVPLVWFCRKKSVCA